MQAARDTVVTLHYTLKDDSGTVIDSSTGGDPLSYLHGHGTIIPGLEKALDGASAGFHSQFTIEPADGYGERRDDMVITAPREQFDPSMDLKPGLQVMGQGPNGDIRFTVSAVTDAEVTLDANHMLAGERLHFDVQVTSVRKATRSEVKHRHAHGADGKSEEVSHG